MFQEFRKFAMRGSVVDLAVGVVWAPPLRVSSIRW